MQRSNQLALVGLILSSILVVSCGETRPSQVEWRAEWIRAMDIVPDRETVTDDLSPIVCEDILTALREEGTDLLPTPSAQLDRQASLWLDTAEGAFFECPPAKGFDSVYDELDDLVAGVNERLEPPIDS